ncbi:hypothetical protein PMIN02_012866 [Paraphaeosphaeria minitans]
MSSQQDDLLASVSTRLSSPATTPTPPTSTAPKELCDTRTLRSDTMARYPAATSQHCSLMDFPQAPSSTCSTYPSLTPHPRLDLHLQFSKPFPQLQSSLRNALATFGPTSAQYASIKYVVDEHMAKAALQSLSLGPREGNGQTMDLAFIPRGE